MGALATHVYTDKNRDPKNALPEGKSINDYNEWGYDMTEDGATSVQVTFDAGKRSVQRVSCIDIDHSKAPHCAALADIQSGGAEEQVTARLGRPNRFKLDGVSKTISYDDLGVEFILTKGHVYYLTLFKGGGQEFDMFKRYLRSIPP